MNRSLVYPGAAVLFAVAWAAPEAVPEEASRATLKRPVIVAIVRHAEKDDEGQDPGLTAAGKVRATRLAALFRKSKLDLLIASDLKRTRETLEPVAKEKSMKISNRIMILSGLFVAAGAAFVLAPSTSARAASTDPPTAGREASTEVMTGSNAEAV